MISCGFDPSLRGFGYLIHDSSKLGPARVIESGRWVTKKKDMIWVERYMRLRSNIFELLERRPEIECVGIESPPFGEMWSEGLYALFTYVNEAVFTKRKDVVYFDPGTVKMLAKVDPKLRKGKMFKSDMKDAAIAETGITKWSSDEADAYHIAKFTARFWTFLRGDLTEADLSPAEKQAFTKVYTPLRGKKAGITQYQGAIFKENQRYFRFSLIKE